MHALLGECSECSRALPSPVSLHAVQLSSVKHHCTDQIKSNHDISGGKADFHKGSFLYIMVSRYCMYIKSLRLVADCTNVERKKKVGCVTLVLYI